MSNDEINDKIQCELSFLDERPSGLLFLPNRCYVKIGSLLGIDYKSLTKTQKGIFKEFCFSDKMSADTDLSVFGIIRTTKN